MLGVQATCDGQCDFSAPREWLSCKDGIGEIVQARGLPLPAYIQVLQ